MERPAPDRRWWSGTIAGSSTSSRRRSLPALRTVQRAAVAFEVALLGENAQYVPQEFIAARKWLGERVVQYGYLPSRADYLEVLGRGSVVVSTAIQENFGISVVEAAAAGCHPLLPRRLAYPEVIPPAYHDACLYDDDEVLAERLIALLSGPPGDAAARLGRRHAALLVGSPRRRIRRAVRGVDAGAPWLATGHPSDAWSKNGAWRAMPGFRSASSSASRRDRAASAKWRSWRRERSDRPELNAPAAAARS